VGVIQNVTNKYSRLYYYTQVNFDVRDTTFIITNRPCVAISYFICQVNFYLIRLHFMTPIAYNNSTLF